jgi:hypothetical protein
MFFKTLFISCLFSIFLFNSRFAFTSVNQEATWRSNEFKLIQLDKQEILEKLSRTRKTHTRFNLYKQLFALQVLSFCSKGGDKDSLASAIQIATTDRNKREDCINNFSEEEKEIFTSYDALINLANELSTNVLNRNNTFHLVITHDEETIQGAEPFKLYYLQILELEDFLHFYVHNPEFWIRQQTADLTTILLCLDKEISAMQLKKIINDTGDLTLDHKEYRFYWETILHLCREFLNHIDNRWKDSNYDRRKILNLIFGQRFTYLFQYSEAVKNPIDMFFPYILDHADLDLTRNRFDQISMKLDAWDQNYEWIVLHIKAAEYLLQTNSEKATAYYERAKELVNDTLWCYFFSPNQEQWNEKKEQALMVIDQYAPLFD